MAAMTIEQNTATVSTPLPSHVAATGLRKFQRLGIVIGAMKAGTSSLFEALNAHPQIAGSSIKETHFFKTAESAAAGLDAYEAYWTFDPSRHLIAMEASPSYSKFPQFPGVPERLAATPYDLRLVYVLRHPIHRYGSNYVQALAKGYDFRDIHREIDPHALSASSYASQLAKYAAHIPREKLLLVRFEDLARNPQSQLDRITAHFGVASARWNGFPHYHASAEHHLSGAIERLVTEGRKSDGLYGPPVVRADGHVDMRATFLPEAVAQRLHMALRDEMRRLQEDWGFDVRPWGF